MALYPLDGGPPRKGPAIEPGAFPVRFSHDGKAVFVASARAGRTSPLRLHRVALATGASTLLHEIRPAELAGVWNLYPASVTSDGRGYAYTYCQFFHNLFLAEGVQ
jgi:hypothetical protein